MNEWSTYEKVTTIVALISTLIAAVRVGSAIYTAKTSAATLKARVEAEVQRKRNEWVEESKRSYADEAIGNAIRSHLGHRNERGRYIAEGLLDLRERYDFPDNESLRKEALLQRPENRWLVPSGAAHHKSQSDTS
jgi:hypothetical protein